METNNWDFLKSPNPQKTLLLIPCSGSKTSGNSPNTSPSVLSYLDPTYASLFIKARTDVGKKAELNEETLMPAYFRYSGELYKNGSNAIASALAIGQQVMIISGGYGLLLANESIGMYNRRFALSDWPEYLLEKCLLTYAQKEGIQSVIAIMSKSTDYAKLIRRTDWRGAGIEAALVSPVPQGGGAMVKVPRAQGQALTALINQGLDQNWQSSDSLSLSIEML